MFVNLPTWSFKLPDLSNPSSWIIIVAIGLAVLLLGGIVYYFIQRNQKTNTNKRRKRNGDSASKRRNTARVKRLDEEKMREIYKNLAEMTATLNYQRVLDIALDMSLQALTESDSSTDRLISAVLLFTQPNSQSQCYISVQRGA